MSAAERAQQNVIEAILRKTVAEQRRKVATLSAECRQLRERVWSLWESNAIKGRLPKTVGTVMFVATRDPLTGKPRTKQQVRRAFEAQLKALDMKAANK